MRDYKLDSLPNKKMFSLNGTLFYNNWDTIHNQDDIETVSIIDPCYFILLMRGSENSWKTHNNPMSMLTVKREWPNQLSNMQLFFVV
jgi:hypothetical protein